MSWSVPRCWPGEVVAIIGGGPSLTPEQVATVRWSGVRSIVVNRAFELLPDADWLHAGDAPFWRAYPEALKFEGIKTTVGAPVGSFVDERVHVLRDTGRTGFDPDPGCVRTGGSSLHQALCVAAHTGARRAVLLGADGKPAKIEQARSSGEVVEVVKNHWHPDHPYPCTNPQPQTYEVWKSALRVLSEVLPMEVLNATPGTAIDAFPMMDLERALLA